MVKLSLSIQYADSDYDWSDILPRPLLRRWVNAALQQSACLTLRFVNEEEGRTLNRDYRAKNYATNVLTFAYNDFDDMDSADFPDEMRATLVAITGEQIEADIILCGTVLQHEAAQQGKSVHAHAAHLIVHGVLHAQGFDHIDETEAELMEELERQILARLGFNDPYADNGVRIAD